MFSGISPYHNTEKVVGKCLFGSRKNPPVTTHSQSSTCIRHAAPLTPDMQNSIPADSPDNGIHESDIQNMPATYHLMLAAKKYQYT